MGTISQLEQSIQKELDSLKMKSNSTKNQISLLENSKYKSSINQMIEINNDLDLMVQLTESGIFKTLKSKDYQT